MGSQIKVSNTWKNSTDHRVKIGGVWKPVTSEYVKVNGVWKPINLIEKGYKVFTSSGTFTVPSGITKVDVCLVGGGYDGVVAKNYSEAAYSYTVQGGNGGAGGKINEKYSISVTSGANYTIVVGAKNGGESRAFGLSSSNYTFWRSSGGKGAYYKNSRDNGSSNYGSSSGVNGKYVFGDSSLFAGNKVGASGGGGGIYLITPSLNYSGASGGSFGGGKGGTEAAGTGGTFYGAGGGGGGYTSRNGVYYNGGSGYAGVVVIRWGY